ncbi:hypothetical protein D3C80_766400 [compost metagenome]
MGDQLQQVTDCKHHQPRCQTGFFGIFLRHDQGPTGCSCSQGCGQNTLHRADRPGQRQFAQAFHLAKRCNRELAVGGENPQGDGQVEAPAILGQVGWREVEGDAPGGEFQAGIEDRAAHPILAFLHGRFRQANQGQRRQTVGQMRFNTDRRGRNTNLGTAVDKGEGHERSMI